MRLGKPGTAAESTYGDGLGENMGDYGMMARFFGLSWFEKPQRAQSSTIPVTTYDKAAAPRFITRMTPIGRIFTDIHDPCVSVSSVLSVFYHNPILIDDDI